MKEQFDKFLKANRGYTKYYKLIHDHWDAEWMGDEVKPEDYISTAFIWENTNDGDYWKSLNKKWRDELKNKLT